MTYRLLYALILGALGILLAFGCKKDDPKPVDPCKGVKPVSAHFVTYPNRYVQPRHLLKDQPDYLAGGNVTFEATDQTAESYEWLVGDDTTRFRKRIFELQFDEPYGKIMIRLIVKRKTACPKFKQTDTLIKYITILDPKMEEFYRFLGTYEGSDDTEPDRKYRIRIGTGVIENEAFMGDGMFVIYDFPCASSEPTYPVFGGGYSFNMVMKPRILLSQECKINFQNNNHCFGYIKDYKDTICIHYTSKPDGKTFQQRLFTGVRIK